MRPIVPMTVEFLVSRCLEAAPDAAVLVLKAHVADCTAVAGPVRNHVDSTVDP
jgi:hypothetical protein